jgi:hypothetical protein
MMLISLSFTVHIYADIVLELATLVIEECQYYWPLTLPQACHFSSREIATPRRILRLLQERRPHILEIPQFELWSVRHFVEFSASGLNTISLLMPSY